MLIDKRDEDIEQEWEVFTTWVQVVVIIVLVSLIMWVVCL